jgi:NDP-sugar pyrophosphorylase family protein
MKAMILAAGLGTRLRPLTEDRPKALVTVAGRTMLEIALQRLRSFGVREVIVNTHHHASMIADYLQANHNFGMSIQISFEPELLDTGGGLKHATPFFLDSSASPQEPFILHNVDVLSTIDLARMVRFHVEHQALATLAVQDRATSRLLLFDQQGRLCGRRTTRAKITDAAMSDQAQADREQADQAQAQEVQTEWALPAAPVQALAFSGIHVLSPRIFAEMPEEGAFSIIPAYLRLAAQGEIIAAFRADEFYWRDLGRPESIQQAAQDMASGMYPVT